MEASCHYWAPPARWLSSSSIAFPASFTGVSRKVARVPYAAGVIQMRARITNILSGSPLVAVIIQHSWDPDPAANWLTYVQAIISNTTPSHVVASTLPLPYVRVALLGLATATVAMDVEVFGLDALPSSEEIA